MPHKVQLGRSNVPYSCTPFFNQTCRHCCTKHFHNFAKNKAKAVLIRKLQAPKHRREFPAAEPFKLQDLLHSLAYFQFTRLFVADHSLCCRPLIGSDKSSSTPNIAGTCAKGRGLSSISTKPKSSIMTFRLCISDSPAWHATRSGSHRSWTMGRGSSMQGPTKGAPCD